MRKLIILLALAMLIFSASASAETDIQALTDANVICVAHETYPNTAQYISYFDIETGEPTEVLISYGVADPDRGMIYTFVNATQETIEIIGGGNGYGYADGQPFMIVFIGDMYEQTMLMYGAQNLGEFAEGQAITGETLSDGKLFITTEGVISEDDWIYGEFAGDTLVVYYVVNPENLIIETAEIYIRGADGVEKLYCATAVETEFDMVKLPFDPAEIMNAEAWREVRIFTDYGTVAEFEYVFEAPVNMPMSVTIPEGYELYNDAEYKEPFAGTPRDENGNYPETQTLYCAPVAE